MSIVTSSSVNKTIPYFSALLVAIVTILGVAGCSSSSSDPDPEVSINATGYYEGTASIKEEDNSTPLPIKDLKVLANGDQVLIMSATNGLLYVLKSINISDSGDYSATVNIFKEGSYLTTTNVSGSITEGVSLTGTFSGLGAGNGSFSVDYSSVNDSDADLATIAEDWEGYLSGTNSRFIFNVNALSGQLVTIVEPLSGILYNCNITASLTPVLNENLYTVTDVELSSCDNTSLNSTGYSGLATAFAAPPPVDKSMVIIFYNDSFSGISEMYLD